MRIETNGRPCAKYHRAARGRGNAVRSGVDGLRADLCGARSRANRARCGRSSRRAGAGRRAGAASRRRSGRPRPSARPPASPLRPCGRGAWFSVSSSMRSPRASASRTSISARACAALTIDSFARMSSTCSSRAAELDLRFFLGAGDDLVAAAQDVFGLADLVRHRGPHLVHEVQQAPAVDDDAGADRHAAAFGDHLFQAIDQV